VLGSVHVVACQWLARKATERRTLLVTSHISIKLSENAFNFGHSKLASTLMSIRTILHTFCPAVSRTLQQKTPFHYRTVEWRV
jgi:hypothetical protein